MDWGKSILSGVAGSGAWVAAGALALSAAPCLARQSTVTMPVQVSVVDGCTVTAVPLYFALPAPKNTTYDSTTTITVACNPNLSYTIDLDYGLHPLGTNRRVYNPSAGTYLNYDIYKDPPRSQVWGRGNTANFAGNSGPLGLVVYPVYGRLTGKSSAAAGAYTDRVTVTVNF